MQTIYKEVFKSVTIGTIGKFWLDSASIDNVDMHYLSVHVYRYIYL